MGRASGGRSQRPCQPGAGRDPPPILDRVLSVRQRYRVGVKRVRPGNEPRFSVLVLGTCVPTCARMDRPDACRLHVVERGGQVGGRVDGRDDRASRRRKALTAAECSRVVVRRVSVGLRLFKIKSEGAVSSGRGRGAHAAAQPFGSFTSADRARRGEPGQNWFSLLLERAPVASKRPFLRVGDVTLQSGWRKRFAELPRSGA